MNDKKVLYAASLFAATSLAALVWRRRGDSRPPYPPGPKGYPLVGSVLDIPRDVPVWQGFSSIAQKYSKWSTFDVRLLLEVIRLTVLPLEDTDVLYLKLFSTDFVILNSSEVICDLLEKRSTIYSDRVSHLIESLSHPHRYTTPRY
jgi:hypothetical protein